MKFTVLGCGDAFGSGGRFTTSFLLQDQERCLLVDCGATTLVRLKQLKISIDAIDTIVLTHFHGDHYGGVPFVILSRHFEYAHRSLNIIGPPGLRERLLTLQEALYPGTSEFYDKLGVVFKEYSERNKLEYEDVSVYARQVTHSPPSNPHGVRVQWKGKVFAYSGDTSWNDSLIDLADGSDLFVIESNNFQQIATGHLSYKEIMEKKDQFRCKKLFLTHMGSDVLDQTQLELSRLEDGMEILF